MQQMGEAMFDELSGLESQDESVHKPSQEETDSSRERGRWSSLVAMLIFCLLYFPLRSHPWAWPVAVAVSYTALTFGLALSSALAYADDFFGDPRVAEYVATLLWPHVFILAPVTLLACLWLRAIPILPHWSTHVHKVSLWELCGIVVFVYLAVIEGDWLAGKVKRRIAEDNN